MKRVIAVIVAVGICGFYWFGCKRVEMPAPVTEELTIIEEEATITPPPPAPEEAEEGTGTPEKMGE